MHAKMLSKLHRNLFTIRTKKVFIVIGILLHAFLMIPNIASFAHSHTQSSIFFASRVVPGYIGGRFSFV